MSKRVSKGEIIKQKSVAGGGTVGYKHVDRLYQPNRERLRLLVRPKKGPNFQRPRKKK
jgi:hypothetical protein